MSNLQIFLVIMVILVCTFLAEIFVWRCTRVRSISNHNIDDKRWWIFPTALIGIVAALIFSVIMLGFRAAENTDIRVTNCRSKIVSQLELKGMTALEVKDNLGVICK